MDLASVYAQLHQQTKELMNHPLHPLWNQLGFMSSMHQLPQNPAMMQQRMPLNPYGLAGYGVDFQSWAMNARLPPLPFAHPHMQNMFAMASPTPSPPFISSYPNTPTPDYHHIGHQGQQNYHLGALMTTDEQSYPCHLCNKRFQKPWHLRTHLTGVHYQLRPHKCAECTMAFRSPYDLKRHQTTHTGERFECDTCAISFGSKQRIAKHIRENVECWAGEQDAKERSPKLVIAETPALSSIKEDSVEQKSPILSLPDAPTTTELLPSAMDVTPISHHPTVSDTDSDHTRTDFDDEEETIADI